MAMENPTEISAPDDVLGSKGGLHVRLARSREEIGAAQRLRFKVFYEELSAIADPSAKSQRTDADRFDEFCDHLIVVRQDPSHGLDPIMLSDGELVGTYRLMRQDMANRLGGYYSAGEFDIGPMLAAHPELQFLELGRSCVLKPYRTKPVLELLWQGIWNYVRHHGCDVMFGCASFEGTDPAAHAAALTFLARNCLAPAEWRVRALPQRAIEMNRIEGALDPKQALRTLPPLIKGYLRLGCYIGEGAVIDPGFNTLDVLIILPVAAINKRYFTHFGAPNE